MLREWRLHCVFPSSFSQRLISSPNKPASYRRKRSIICRAVSASARSCSGVFLLPPSRHRNLAAGLDAVRTIVAHVRRFFRCEEVFPGVFQFPSPKILGRAGHLTMSMSDFFMSYLVRREAGPDLPAREGSEAYGKHARGYFNEDPWRGLQLLNARRLKAEFAGCARHLPLGAPRITHQRPFPTAGHFAKRTASSTWQTGPKFTWRRRRGSRLSACRLR